MSRRFSFLFDLVKLASYTFSEPSIQLSTLLQLPDFSPEFSYIALRRTEVASSGVVVGF